MLLPKDIISGKPALKESKSISTSYLQYKGLPHPKDISSIRYSIEEDSKMECWGPSYGVPVLVPDEIQTIISGKDRKLLGYKRCDETWLLIVTDYGMPSSHFRMPENLTQFHYETQFDRILLLIKTEGSIWKARG